MPSQIGTSQITLMTFIMFRFNQAKLSGRIMFRDGGRYKIWEGVSNNLVGIICPPIEIKLTVPPPPHPPPDPSSAIPNVNFQF